MKAFLEATSLVLHYVLSSENGATTTRMGDGFMIPLKVKFLKEGEKSMPQNFDACIWRAFDGFEMIIYVWSWPASLHKGGSSVDLEPKG